MTKGGLGQPVQGWPSSFFPSIHLCFWPQQVCVLGLHLAKELCEVDEDGDSWLQVTRRLPILPTLFTTLEVSLRMKQNLHFTEAALHLLLTLARTQQVGGKPKAGGCHPACAGWVWHCLWFSISSGLRREPHLPPGGWQQGQVPSHYASSLPREPQQWLELASPRASVCPS